MINTFRTHIGWVRQVNEDSGAIVYLDHQTVLAMIADGMGGHNAGDVASRMAIEIIQSEIQARWRETDWETLLMHAVTLANEKIFGIASEQKELDGMGTTIEVSLLSPHRGVVAHVGDSRAYLYQNSVLRQITEDHSLVYALYKNGQITSEEAANHPQKNLILRALGTDPEIEVDIITFTWNPGDRFLLCTDGFSNHLSHEKLLDYLQKPIPIEQLSDEMMETVLKLGGDDNITFMIIENTGSHDQGGEHK